MGEMGEKLVLRLLKPKLLLSTLTTPGRLAIMASNDVGAGPVADMGVATGVGTNETGAGGGSALVTAFKRNVKSSPGSRSSFFAADMVTL